MGTQDGGPNGQIGGDPNSQAGGASGSMSSIEHNGQNVLSLMGHPMYI